MEKDLMPADTDSMNTSLNDVPFPDERHSGECVLRSIQLIELRVLKIVDFICSKHQIMYWLDGGTLLGAIRHEGFIPWDDDIDIAMPRKDYERFLSLAPSVLPDDLELEKVDDKRGGHKCYAAPCKIRDRYSLITKISPDSIADENRGLFIDIFPVDGFRQSGFGRCADSTLKAIFRNLSKINDAKYSSAGRAHKAAHWLLDRFHPIMDSEFPVKKFHQFLHHRVIPKRLDMPDARILGYGFDVHWTRLFKLEDIYPLRRASFEGYDFLVPHNPDGILKVFYGDYMQLPPVPQRQPKHVMSLTIDTRLSQSSKSVSFEAYDRADSLGPSFQVPTT